MKKKKRVNTKVLTQEFISEIQEIGDILNKNDVSYSIAIKAGDNHAFLMMNGNSSEIFQLITLLHEHLNESEKQNSKVVN